MDEIQVPLLTQSMCPESLRLQHSWWMCKTNKLIYIYIAHEALFQRACNSEGCNGIDYDGKKDIAL